MERRKFSLELVIEIDVGELLVVKEENEDNVFDYYGNVSYFFLLIFLNMFGWKFLFFYVLIIFNFVCKMVSL